MKNSKQIGVFSYFIIFSLLFNAPAITWSTFSELVTVYLAIVFFSMIFFMAYLNRHPLYCSNLDALIRTSKDWLSLNFILYSLVVSLYLYNSLSYISLDYFLSMATYERRLAAVAVDKYWIIELVVKIGFALSIVYLLKRDYFKWLVVAILFVLFYLTSVQKSPIATFFVVNFLVYLKVNKISLRFALVASAIFVLVLFYFTIVTLGDVDFMRIDLLLNAISERVFVAGELIVFLYKRFEEYDLYLYGATLPKLFGFFDLNLSGNYVRLPSFIMAMRSFEDGGANTSFFTEGFANFGVGFDLIFIVFFISFVGFVLFLVRSLKCKFYAFFLIVTSLLLIDLVHVDMWGVFHSIVLLFLYHLVGYLLMTVRFRFFGQNYISYPKSP